MMCLEQFIFVKDVELKCMALFIGIRKKSCFIVQNVFMKLNLSVIAKI